MGPTASSLVVLQQIRFRKAALKDNKIMIQTSIKVMHILLDLAMMQCVNLQ